MNQVDLIPCFLRSARMRRAPTRPNSPRDIGVGEVNPRAIQPDTASKSKVRQTIRLAIADAPLARWIVNIWLAGSASAKLSGHNLARISARLARLPATGTASLEQIS